ncbi:MAG: LapA family protein [Calditrichaeota bacterium]|nr:LapA family protein [Calditrichota bacterium]
MWIIRWLIGAVILLIVIGFALQNQEQTVSVSFLKWHTPNLPLWVYLYASFAVGLLTWFLVSIGNTLSLKAEVRRAQKEVKRLQEELDRLRNLSIEADEGEETEA